jgi:cyanophycin synthetase
MSLSITPKLIIAAAEKRGWKVTILAEKSTFYRIDLPSGAYYYLKNISSVESSVVNDFIAKKKDVFYSLLQTLGLPTPDTMLYTGDTQAAHQFLAKHPGGVVVKPTDQAHGKGITTSITTPQALEEALQYAAGFGKKALIQQQIEGDDYRLLMIGGKLAAAAIRKPAYVVGDGTHTVEALIDAENASARRGDGYQELLTTIDTTSAERYMGRKLQDIPAAGQEVRVIDMANIGRGGVSIDVTDTVSPELVQLAEKVVNHFQLGVCGVDFLVTSSGEPYLIEINTRPSLGLHEFPFAGTARHTPEKFLDWLTASEKV